MSARYEKPCCLFSLVLALGLCGARLGAASLRNPALEVAVAPDGSYEILTPDSRIPVLRAHVGAEINHHWVQSRSYPLHREKSAEFQDSLGAGQSINMRFSGSASEPNLTYTLRLYDHLPFGDIEVQVRNTTAKTLTVQAIRLVDALGKTQVNLGAPPSQDRILSDSFSEDDPNLRIYDLGAAPNEVHLGVGSQLIYNRLSKRSIFLGALTSRRFLTIIHLYAQTAPHDAFRIGSLTVDSTGTTEAERAGPLHGAPTRSLIELSLPVEPGKAISSERLMFAAGKDYHEQLEQYGRAVRILHDARVGGNAPMGWWSWTALYRNINQQAALTNAKWLAKHLAPSGFVYFHIDEGYDYARGEYTTPNAHKFPNGMRWLGRQVHSLGLKLGVWTAPFEVSVRSTVSQNHKDWLVRNLQGDPLQVGGFHAGQESIYVLDTTNPFAQEYLRKTYKTIAGAWGVKYIKLDFMETTAVEGRYYHRNTTALQAERIGLSIIRDAVGHDVLLDKDGSPMLVPVGLVDEGRISVDTGHSFWASQEAEPGIAARYYMNRNFFVSDPDAFTVSRQSIYDHSWPNSTVPLTLNEAQVSIVLAALAGGMYEIGDDLPTLGADPDRLALVKNSDLLTMVRRGRAAIPLDLMSYRNQDQQPSVFLLHETRHKTIVAVFNWTEQPHSHILTVTQLGLPPGHSYRALDVLDGDKTVSVRGGVLRLDNQARHSVKLIKLIDAATPLPER